MTGIPRPHWSGDLLSLAPGTSASFEVTIPVGGSFGGRFRALTEGGKPIGRCMLSFTASSHGRTSVEKPIKVSTQWKNVEIDLSVLAAREVTIQMANPAGSEPVTVNVAGPRLIGRAPFTEVLAVAYRHFRYLGPALVARKILAWAYRDMSSRKSESPPESGV